MVFLFWVFRCGFFVLCSGYANTLPNEELVEQGAKEQSMVHIKFLFSVVWTRGLVGISAVTSSPEANVAVKEVHWSQGWWISHINLSPFSWRIVCSVISNNASKFVCVLLVCYKTSLPLARPGVHQTRPVRAASRARMRLWKLSRDERRGALAVQPAILRIGLISISLISI